MFSRESGPSDPNSVPIVETGLTLDAKSKYVVAELEVLRSCSDIQRNK